MARQTNLRRIIGGVLIVAGIVIVLSVGAVWVRQRVQGEELRAQLRQTPAATLMPLPTATPVPSATATDPAPTATATLPPTPTFQPTGIPVTATQTPAPTASPTPARAQVTITQALTGTTATAPDVPARILIPDLKIDAKVVEMGWEVVNTAASAESDWVIPRYEAGYHINSAALNQGGNLVISGHNNIYGKVFMAISQAWDDRTRVRVDDFTDRSDILKGRKIRLFDVVGQPFDYTITDFLRLRDRDVSLAQRLENARFMEPTDDNRLTLVTCWPPDSNSHRLIVIAKPSQP